MKLDENDFLTYQLYTASKSPGIKKARIRGWILTTFTFLCLAFLFVINDNEFLGYYFMVVSALSLILYPVYSRWRYKKHYIKYISDTYRNRLGQESEFEINKEFIITRDKTGEAKINTDAIEEINEIRDFIFVKLNTGVSLIISKEKTENLNLIQNELKSLSQTKGIDYNEELDWKWR